MPDDTNTTDDQVQADAEQVVEQADTEVAAPEQVAQEEAPADIDINEYSQQRYPGIPQTQAADLTAEMAQELSQLPTDETGTVEASAVAEWFANKYSQVEQRAVQAAERRAQEVFMSDAAEKTQQQQLLKQYPEITKDRDTLEAIFDLRDAAALRGENLSLMQAAGRLDKLRQQYKQEGVQSATRTTTIQAAAHLESSGQSVKSDGGKSQLAAQAFQGRGQEAIDARRTLLRQYVQEELKQGRIQHP